MLAILPVVARSHPLCWKLDPSICNVLSIGLQLGSCLTILIVAVRENAWPAGRRTRNTFSVCSKVSNRSGSQPSTTYIKPARESRTAKVPEPDPSLHFITNHKDGLLLRDLIVRAAAFNGCGKLPMDRWLSDGADLELEHAIEAGFLGHQQTTLV